MIKVKFELQRFTDVVQNFNALSNIESGSCGENVYWSIDDDGTLTISGTGRMNDYLIEDKDSDYYGWFYGTPWNEFKQNITRIVINDGVTSVGSHAFTDMENLKSVMISDSVNFIGSQAFVNCINLESMDLPTSVTGLGEKAFAGCRALKTVNLPQGLTSIGNMAFENCKNLESVDLPTGVTEIGVRTFANCDALKTINLPQGLTSICDGAFANCVSLETITIPSTTKLGKGVFENCSRLSNMQISSDGKTLVASNNLNAHEYTRWAKPINSYLYVDGGNLIRVENVKGQLVVEKYSPELELISSQRIDLDFELWGGFYAGSDANYVITGKSNDAESDDAEVIRVTKYDKNWNYLSDVKIYGANTQTPFAAASLRCAESDGKLYIRTGHRMYKSSDGANHQANMTITLDEATMEIADASYLVSYNSTAYVSHSFNQHILIDSDKNILLFDHGDAYPRAALLSRYKNAAAGGNFRGPTENIELVNFAGNIGDNATGSAIGGLAETADYYVSAYTYDGVGGDDSKSRSLYVAFTSKNDFSISGTKTLKVAENAGTPMIVPVDKNSGYILWNEMEQDGQYFKPTGKICSASYDNNGNVNLGSVSVGQLSECQPIIYNGKIVLYVTEDSAPNFYVFDGENYVSYSSTGVTLPDGITINGATLTASIAFTGNSIDLSQRYASGSTKVEASALSRGISIFGTAKSNSLKGGKGADTIFGAAGNDTISLGGGADIYVYESGNDLIQDYTAGEDKIKLASSSITGASLSDSNVVLKTSTGNITVKGAKNETITVIDKNGSETSKIYPEITLPAGISVSGAVLTASTVFTGSKIDLADYASTVTKVNASALTRGVTIVGSSADNSLKGGSGATIFGGAGNDTIENHGKNSLLDGGDGDDIIYNHNSSATITSGTGNDSIYNEGNSVIVFGGNDNDSVISKGDNAKVYGGAGNDILNVEVFSAYNWNDNRWENTIYSGATIDGGSGDDYIFNHNSSASINAGTGADSVKNYNDSATIIGDSGNDIIINGEFFARGGVSVKLHGGDGADTITSSGSNSVLDGGAGDDFIFNGKYFYSAPDWAPTYYNSSNNGENDDSLKSSNVTISGGAGNDSIDNNGERVIYVYNTGDGDDTISGYGDRDTIKISSSYSTQTSGYSDILINVGSGSILLKNASGKTLNIVSDSDIDTDTFPAGVSISNATLTASTAFTGNSINLADYAATVTKVNASALSRGVSIVGSSAANSLKGGKGADTIFGGAGNDTVSLGGGADIYVYSSGNDLIQDYVAGTDKIKLSGTSITSASVSGSNVVLKTSSGNITVKGRKGKAITVIDASGKETSQVYPLSTLPAGISVSGATLTASSAFTGSEIDLADYATNVTKVNASAVTKNISIVGSSAANSLKSGKGADTIFGGAGNDTVSLGGGADVYVYSSGNDLIQDYVAGTDKIKLSGTSITSASVSGSNVVLKTSSGNLTVKNAKNKKITVIDASGNETSQVYPLSTLPAGISVSGAVLTATAAFTGSEIDLADYATNVTKVNASAVTKNISIVGSSAANSLKGGKGADTIFGGAGNDTVSLGGGADVYVYSSGNDLIQDYTVGADKIKLASASITGASLSGSNVVLKTSSGNITVKGRKGKAITVIDASGKETSQVYPLSTLPAGISVSGATLTASSAFIGSEIDLTDYATNVTKVNASAVTKNISIIGNAKANSLKGGKGTDTIFGGAGNDTLYGGAGSDTFVYASGKDVIADYAAGDKIKISSGTISKTAYSGQNVVFTVGSGSITVRNGKSKKITITDASGRTSTKTYTTGVSYGSNGNAAVSWFTEDDINFISASANLDEISAEKFSVTNVETPANYENLAQENPIVLVSSNK